MHKRLKGIPILNGDVMDAPVQHGIADLDKWFSTYIALLKDTTSLYVPWRKSFTEFVNLDVVNVRKNSWNQAP